MQSRREVDRREVYGGRGGTDALRVSWVHRGRLTTLASAATVLAACSNEAPGDVLTPTLVGEAPRRGESPDGFTLDDKTFEPEPQPFADCDAFQTASPRFIPVNTKSAQEQLYVWVDEAEAQTIGPFVAPLVESSWRETLAASNPGASVRAQKLFPTVFAGGAQITWPNPWATRLLTDVARPRLLKFEVQRNARWLLLNGDDVVVVDHFGTVIDEVAALASPELIAGVFAAAPYVEAGQCGPSHARSFVLTNTAMIRGWSIGQNDDIERVRDDVESLEALLLGLRSCPFDADFEVWSQAMACTNYAGSDDDVGRFVRGLSLVNESYYPGTRELARLVDTLEDDVRRWSAAPLVVKGARLPSGDTGDEFDHDAGAGVTDASASSDADTGQADASIVSNSPADAPVSGGALGDAGPIESGGAL